MLFVQRASRAQLKVTMNEGKGLMDAMLLDQEVRMKRLAELAAPLRPIAAACKKPVLQVLYLGASALHSGAPRLSPTYPIAIAHTPRSYPHCSYLPVAI